MKHLFLILSFVIPLPGDGGQSVVVSAGGKLSVYAITENALSLAQTVELNGNSGPLDVSADQRFIYVNTSISPEGEPQKNGRSPAIATFSISPEGRLKHLHTAESGWSGGYLRVDSSNSFLAGNHYGAGKVGTWKLNRDRIYDGATVIEFALEKRAHSAVFSPDNRFLFVPATGPNKIFQLVFNVATGRVHPNQPSSAPGPSQPDAARQPRHLVFHPTKNIAYTTNEREVPGAGVWSYDPEKGLLESIQGIPSVDQGVEGITTADLHLSGDARFLYVSNRDILNQKKPEGRDAIAVFRVDPETGKLSFEKRFPCERIPRSFAIGIKGESLFVSGQADHKLGHYQINRETGHLTKLNQYPLPGRPSWVAIMNPDPE